MRTSFWTAFGLIAVAFSAGCTTVTTEEPDPPSLDPWAKAYPGVAAPQVIASGAEGDLFIGGTFNDAIDFGGGQLTAEPHGSIFMAHLDAEAGHLFSGSTGSQDQVRTVAIGPQDDLYIAGGYDGFINFGDGVLDGTHDGYFAAFAEDGSSAYSKSIDSTLLQVIIDKVETAPNGDVLLAARADDTTDFGRGVGPSPQGLPQGVIAAYDREGHALWETRINGNFGNELSMAVDGAGDVFIAASAYGSVTMAGTTIEDSAFLAKIDPNGKPLWLRAISPGAFSVPTIHDLSTDDAGNVYFAGVYYGDFSYGGIKLPFSDNQNGYLAKASPDGDPLFAKSFKSMNYIQNIELAASGKGEIVIALSAFGGVDFGSGVISNPDSYDAFLARYSPDGNVVSTMVLDGTGTEYVTDLALAPNGKPVICGAFDSLLDFGKTRLTAGTSTTMFVARVDF